MQPGRWGKNAVLIAAGSGCLLLWLALPPCGWFPLGWFAPLPWLWLVRQPVLPGRRPYLALWAASSAFWLVYLQGVRLAHPALYLGWLALSLYLAVYLPVFIALTRAAVGRLGCPLALAAPITWIGLETIRSRLVSGFTGGMLAHTQTPWTLAIQVADLGGAYLLSGLMMAIAACLLESVLAWRARRLDEHAGGGRRAATYLVAATTLLAGTLGYGAWRLAHSPLPHADPADRLRIALIQESIDTIFEYHPERNVEAFRRYLDRTAAACAEHGPLDVVVWPESMFTENTPEFLADPGVTSDELLARQVAFQRKVQVAASRLRPRPPADASPAPPTPPHAPVLIAGTITLHITPPTGREYNTALLIRPDGQVTDRYYKRHLVMFGEYIPAGNWFPWLYQLAGMPGGLTAGEEPRAFQVDGWRMAPSICFESLVPHLLRDHAVALERRGTPADVQVNLTNDGWFWGSSLLDMHLQGGVFRAVELRRPFVIAANTGLSAWIDSDGRLRQVAPRRQGATLLATVERDQRTPLYQRIGDLPWAGCAILTLLLVGPLFWPVRRPDLAGT
ncbi:MAG: apolipoprotein N-acyltransferase [Pirellulales bacterium]